MTTTKMSTILVLGLVVSQASVAEGAQYLRVNGQDVNSITLKVGQGCIVEVVSDDSNPHTAYVGFDDGLVLGVFLHLETVPVAGDLASVTDHNVPAFRGYYVSAAGTSPPPSAGVHFIFEYMTQQLGETDLKLYDSTFTSVIDSVDITVISTSMDTGFTYQGRLMDGNRPADGLYDLLFVLYETPDGFEELGVIVTEDVEVIDGFFTVKLDFGAVFDGNERWLQIEVRPAELSDPEAFTVLSPRQQITPAPYAIYAGTAGGGSGGVDGAGSGRSFGAADGSPDDAVYVDNEGNVGIGTTTPAEDLDVDGDIRASSSIRCGNTVGFFKPDRILSDTGTIVIGKEVSGVFDPDISVGIGTSSPNTGSKLEVGGNIRVSYPPKSQNAYASLTLLCKNRDAVINYMEEGATAPKWQTYLDGDRPGDPDPFVIACDTGRRVTINSSGGIRSTAAPGTVESLTLASGQDKDVVINYMEDGDVKWQTYLDADVSGEPFVIRCPHTNRRVTIDNQGTLKTRVLEITDGSDLSEQFQISGKDEKSSPLPGMVVSIDTENPGNLIVSNKAYDCRVAGIISGAGGIRPGMLMGQKGSNADGTYPVALTGRVYCWADASNGPIGPGDLLTTSETPGHAMKIADRSKGYGAILGKAMTGLSEGKGLVLVLVALQ